MEKISFETFKRPNGHDEFLEWDASSSTVEMGEKIRH